jgi:RNA polymerase sigma factor (sigma-70 family)
MTNEELVEQIKAGRTDLTLELYNKNFGLINNVCRHYSHSKEDLEDLLQQSYISLIKAVDTFDSTKSQFSTYLVHILKGDISRYLRYTQLLRPPLGYTKFKRLLERYPNITDDEIINKLNINVEELEKLKAYHNPTSLDIPTGTDGTDSIKDLIPCASYSLEDDVTEKVFEDSKHEIWGIIEDNTGDKANRCIQGYYRYGKTFKEIADQENVTASGIRELINTNLKALRRGRVANILKSKFMEVEATMYHGSITSFKYTDSSIQEKIVLRKEFYEQKYKVK